MLPIFQHYIFTYLDTPTLIALRAIPNFHQAATTIILQRNPIEMVQALYPQQTKKWSEDISSCPHLTLELIKRFRKNINWYRLSSNPCLTPAIIDLYHEKLDWLGDNGGLDEHETLSANPALIGKGVHPLSFAEVINLLDRHSDRIDWRIFYEYQDVSIELIEHYYFDAEIEWSFLLQNKHLTIEMFERFINEWEEPFVNAIRVTLERDLITSDFIERQHDTFCSDTWELISYPCLNKFPRLILDHPDWPWKWN